MLRTFQFRLRPNATQRVLLERVLADNCETYGFPRFRARARYDSFAFSLPVCRERSIKIPNVADIRARGGRPIEGRAKLCTVKRDGKRWTASVVCDVGEAPEKCVVSRVGIDVGLTTLATLSDGTQIENPRWTKRHERRIAQANRVLARKKRGSRNRLKAREALHRAHQSAANARLNYIHHVSKWLVENYDLIAFEDLKIRNMVRNPHLAKSIMDAAWGLLIWCITYKAEGAGAWALPVNPRGTSQTCCGCGRIVKKKLSERWHSCPCGAELGRDHNSGINIKQLALSALGMSDVVVQAESMQDSIGESCI
jgi:putative transposase